MRRCSLLLSLLLVAVTLQACDRAGGDYAIGEDDEYVALGDSYTAAPMIGAPDGRDGCGRTVDNYPHRIADATGADLGDVSCSGATSDHLVTAQKTPRGERPPQLDALSGSTDLVTLGIGANDFFLIGSIVRNCVTNSVNAAPDATPCIDFDRAEGGSTSAQNVAEVETRLLQRLAEIEERAPDATVMVIGYPAIIPDDGTCDLLPITEGDYAWARGVMEGVNDSLESAAEQAAVEYVDVFAATRGHDICADEPWVAGSTPNRIRGQQWHPYPEEQQVVADLILAKLAE